MKLKEGTLDSLLLTLMDAISECQEHLCENSGHNWHDTITRNFFDEVPDTPVKE